MKTTTLGVLLLAVWPAASMADVAFNAALVSDYRYRGISQTRFDPALQAGIDWSRGGAYGGAWATNVKWIDDGGGDAEVELDLYGGYKGAFGDSGVGYDVGLLSYRYPGHGLSPSPTTNEVYGALAWGPAALKLSHALSNLFGFADSSGSRYVDLSATFDVAGFAVTPHVGHQTVRRHGAFSYTDVALTVSRTFGSWVASATLLDTDSDAYRAPNGKNLGRAGVVLGLKFNF